MNADITNGEILEAINNFATSVDNRFEQVDGRLDKMDGRLDKMDSRFDHIDARLSYIERDVAEIRKHFVYREEFEDLMARVKYLEQKLEIKSEM